MISGSLRELALKNSFLNEGIFKSAFTMITIISSPLTSRDIFFH